MSLPSKCHELKSNIGFTFAEISQRGSETIYKNRGGQSDPPCYFQDSITLLQYY